MRDLNKWFLGLASVALVSLVGCVISIRGTMIAIQTEMRLTSSHIEKTATGYSDALAKHSTILSGHETRIVKLEGKDLIHDKYDDRLDLLVPLVQEILIKME